MNSLILQASITFLRKQKGWSQSDLAKSIQTFKKLAKILDTTVGYLLGENELLVDMKEGWQSQPLK